MLTKTIKNKNITSLLNHKCVKFDQSYIGLTFLALPQLVIIEFDLPCDAQRPISRVPSLQRQSSDRYCHDNM